MKAKWVHSRSSGGGLVAQFYNLFVPKATPPDQLAAALVAAVTARTGGRDHKWYVAESAPAGTFTAVNYEDGDPPSRRLHLAIWSEAALPGTGGENDNDQGQPEVELAIPLSFFEPFGFSAEADGPDADQPDGNQPAAADRPSAHADRPNVDAEQPNVDARPGGAAAAAAQPDTDAGPAAAAHDRAANPPEQSPTPLPVAGGWIWDRRAAKVVGHTRNKAVHTVPVINGCWLIAPADPSPDEWVKFEALNRQGKRLYGKQVME